MIPTYPFQVHSWFRGKGEANILYYQTLSAAVESAESLRKKPGVTCVQVWMIIDETHHTGG